MLVTDSVRSFILLLALMSLPAVAWASEAPTSISVGPSLISLGMSEKEVRKQLGPGCELVSRPRASGAGADILCGTDDDRKRSVAHLDFDDDKRVVRASEYLPKEWLNEQSFESIAGLLELLRGAIDESGSAVTLGVETESHPEFESQVLDFVWNGRTVRWVLIVDDVGGRSLHVVEIVEAAAVLDPDLGSSTQTGEDLPSDLPDDDEPVAEEDG